MITCRELTEFLDDYVADALPPERRAVFEQHLAVCPDCRNYLASYRGTIALGRAAGRQVAAAEVPEGVRRAVLAAVSAARKDAGAWPTT